MSVLSEDDMSAVIRMGGFPYALQRRFLR
jgi:hypothetical protein